MKKLRNTFENFRQTCTEFWVNMTQSPTLASKRSSYWLNSLPEKEEITRQIEKAIHNPTNRLTFLVAPMDIAKNEYITFFCEKNYHFHYIYRSFMRIRELSYAYTHLTNFSSRFTLLILSLLLVYGLILLFPILGTTPILLTLGYFIVHNPASLTYIFAEALDNLFTQKNKIYIIDDLEKCYLDMEDKWSFLSNLWMHNRRYIIPIGYSTKDEKEKEILLDNITKLGGIIVDIEEVLERKNIEWDSSMQKVNKLTIDGISIEKLHDFVVLNKK